MCVRALPLGMPGFTNAGVSSGFRPARETEIPRESGTTQIACDPFAHTSRLLLEEYSDPIMLPTRPWPCQRGGQLRSACRAPRDWYLDCDRDTVMYMIQLMQTQTATAQDPYLGPCMHFISNRV